MKFSPLAVVLLASTTLVSVTSAAVTGGIRGSIDRTQTRRVEGIGELGDSPDEAAKDNSESEKKRKQEVRKIINSYTQTVDANLKNFLKEIGEFDDSEKDLGKAADKTSANYENLGDTALEKSSSKGTKLLGKP